MNLRRLPYTILFAAIFSFLIPMLSQTAEAQITNHGNIQIIEDALPEGVSLESASYDQIYAAMYDVALEFTCSCSIIAEELIAYLQSERGQLPSGVVENITAAATRAVFERLQFLTECSATLVLANLRQVSLNVQIQILTSS